MNKDWATNVSIGEDILNFKPIDETGIHLKQKVDLKDEFLKKLRGFNPEMVAVSCLSTERFIAQLKLTKIPKNSAKIRIRNRCNLTGRPRGYYRKFGLSRISLREMASSGKIPGITKASW